MTALRCLKLQTAQDCDCFLGYVTTQQHKFVTFSKLFLSAMNPKYILILTFIKAKIRAYFYLKKKYFIRPSCKWLILEHKMLLVD
jgi:hypothetical protein